MRQRSWLALLVVGCFFVFSPAYGQLELIEVGRPAATPAVRHGPDFVTDPAVVPPAGCPDSLSARCDGSVFSCDVPTFVDGNIARAPDAVAFGSPAWYCNHHPVENINDGVYGACSKFTSKYPGAETGPNEIMTTSRRGDIESRYVGIYWTGGAKTISEVALGTDNVNPDRRIYEACGRGGRGGMEACSGGCLPYEIYYTTDSTFKDNVMPCLHSEPCTPPAGNPECMDSWINRVNWQLLGIAGDHIATATVGLRHRYRLPAPITGVWAVRVLLWPVVGDVSLDELELGDADNALGDPPTTDMTLRETGGPFTTPAASDDVPSWDEDPEQDFGPPFIAVFNEENIARRADAIPFGSNPVDVAKLNDGVYGDAWVGSPFVPSPSLNLPGDMNQDGGLDLADSVALLGYLFQGTFTLPCGTVSSNLTLMDVNGDAGGNINGIDLADVISLLSYLFQGDDEPVSGVVCIDIPGCPQNVPACGAAGAGAGGGETFAGIYFDELMSPVAPHIREIALGRDNTGVETDRAVGEHRIQFTTEVFAPTSPSAAANVTWTDVHPRRAFARAHVGASNAGLRRRYLINDPQVRYYQPAHPTFEALTQSNAPIQARAIRIVTQEGNAFDEVELAGGTFVPMTGKDVGIRVDYTRKLPELVEDPTERGGPGGTDCDGPPDGPLRADPNGVEDVPTWEEGNVARARMGPSPTRNPCARVGDDPGPGCDPVELPECAGECASPPDAYDQDRSALPGTPTDAVAFGTMPWNVGHVLSRAAPRLNDGLYGAGNTWFGGAPGPATGLWYVGIYWTGGPRTINAVALGRDNDCLQGVAGDRHQYPFTLQYTTDDFDFPHERWLRPDKGVAEATWISVGTMQGHLTGPQPWKVRHLYEFTPITARAVRVLVMNQDIRRLNVSSFTSIDELEVFEQ